MWWHYTFSAFAVSSTLSASVHIWIFVRIILRPPLINPAVMESSPGSLLFFNFRVTADNSCMAGALMACSCFSVYTLSTCIIPLSWGLSNSLKQSAHSYSSLYHFLLWLHDYFNKERFWLKTLRNHFYTPMQWTHVLICQYYILYLTWNAYYK